MAVENIEYIAITFSNLQVHLHSAGFIVLRILNRYMYLHNCRLALVIISMPDRLSTIITLALRSC